MPLVTPGQEPERSRPQYSDAHIDALVAYVASLGGGPPVPRPDPAAGNVARGPADLHRVVQRLSPDRGARRRRHGWLLAVAPVGFDPADLRGRAPRSVGDAGVRPRAALGRAARLCREVRALDAPPGRSRRLGHLEHRSGARGHGRRGCLAPPRCSSWRGSSARGDRGEVDHLAARAAARPREAHATR